VIGNGHAGFGRATSEKDLQGHLADVVPRRAAIPGRPRPYGRTSGCATRCAHGSSDTAGHPRQPIGLGRAPADAAARHSSDSEPETGRRRRPSSTSTDPGLPLTRTRSPTADGASAGGHRPSRPVPTKRRARPAPAAQPRSRPGGGRWLARAVGRQSHLPARYLGLLERRRRRHLEILLRLVGVRYLRCVVVVLRVAGSTGTRGSCLPLARPGESAL